MVTMVPSLRAVSAWKRRDVRSPRGKATMSDLLWRTAASLADAGQGDITMEATLLEPANCIIDGSL